MRYLLFYWNILSLQTHIHPSYIHSQQMTEIEVHFNSGNAEKLSDDQPLCRVTLDGVRNGPYLFSSMQISLFILSTKLIGIFSVQSLCAHPVDIKPYCHAVLRLWFPVVDTSLLLSIWQWQLRWRVTGFVYDNPQAGMSFFSFAFWWGIAFSTWAVQIEMRW